MSSIDPKSSRSSNSSSNNDIKRLKTNDSSDPTINDNYCQHLDQLTDWYVSANEPMDHKLDTSGARLITDPFKVICFEDFIKSEEFLKKLKQEIKQMDLNVKNNDLYRLRQSIDLNNIKSGSIGQLCQLFLHKIKPFVERLTNISLNDNIALTVSRYEQNGLYSL